jgi:hypothetical protein
MRKAIPRARVVTNSAEIRLLALSHPAYRWHENFIGVSRQLQEPVNRWKLKGTNAKT